MSPRKKAANNDKLQIKLVRSLNGRLDNQIATAKSLGLKRPGDVTIQPNNEATRGKINKISFMLEVNVVK